MANILIGLYAIVTSLGLIFVKLGTNGGMPVTYTGGRLHVHVNFYVISGVFLYGVSFLLYMYLISKNDLGYIIPLTTALVYTIIFVASYFVFHEVFTVAKIMGIGLILAGLIFLNLPK
jgi:drug/metabolite transporter (DMT)-like permease